MPAPYGPQPTGFSKKNLTEILTEIEADGIATFGAGVIQTPQSPLGQLNGLFASASAVTWNIMEDVYRAFDPDQTEGAALTRLGAIRGVERPVGESDIDYQKRITNSGRSDISVRPLINALSAVADVEYIRVHANDNDATTQDGIPGHSLAIAAIGGLDDDIADVIYNETVSGIGLYGNTTVNKEVEGFCRAVTFIRPTQIPITIHIEGQAIPSSCGCTPPSQVSVFEALSGNLGFAGACGMSHGEDVTESRLRQGLNTLNGLDITSITFSRDGDPLDNVTVEIDLFEIATFSSDNITVSYV